MSVKLYRNNETGEVVAACIKHDIAYIFNGSNVKNMIEGHFLLSYTALPEAPDVGSDEWAMSMVLQGKKVRHKDSEKIAHSKFSFAKLIVNHILYQEKNTGWQLYEEPKPIMELLPHDFVQGQEVLVAIPDGTWIKKEFSHVKENIFYTIREHDGKLYSWRYCLPYAGNEHLEGTITDGEHGAVPRGYVPPHVPQLGDDDYWKVGDEIIDLSKLQIYTIHNSSQDGLWFYGKDSRGYTIKFNKYGELDFSRIRIVWHVGSGVNDDGTVNENAPTRPHRIES